MVLSSNNLVEQHAFCHKSIESCLFHILQNNPSDIRSINPIGGGNESVSIDYNDDKALNSVNLWSGRVDTSLSTEVFFIDNKIEYTNEIDIFCLFILTTYSSFGKENNLSTKLQTYIENFGRN